MQMINILQGILDTGVHSPVNEKVLKAMFGLDDLSAFTEENINIAKNSHKLLIGKLPDSARDGMSVEEAEMAVMELIDQIGAALLGNVKKFPVLNKDEGFLEDRAWSCGVISATCAITNKSGTLKPFHLKDRFGLFVLRGRADKQDFINRYLEPNTKHSPFETAVMHHILEEDEDGMREPEVFVDSEFMMSTETALYYPSTTGVEDCARDYIMASESYGKFFDSHEALNRPDLEPVETTAFAKLEIKRFKRKKITAKPKAVEANGLVLEIPQVEITKQKFTFTDIKGHRMSGYLFNV